MNRWVGWMFHPRDRPTSGSKRRYCKNLGESILEAGSWRRKNSRSDLAQGFCSIFQTRAPTFRTQGNWDRTEQGRSAPATRRIEVAF